MNRVSLPAQGTLPPEPFRTPTHPAGTPGDMTMSLPSSKVTDGHQQRKAVVYIRQSTPQQVIEHRESADRQYSLVHRATLLGWPQERVEVVDEDQGRSGQTAEGRLGFQYLLAEVGLDHVGIILGLEMSRLARSNKDWHQLLELCAIFHTLLADQDGLYDPTDFNDRLLLGLKGTMSEAELHILRSRMYKGLLNKAQRGEVYNHPHRHQVKE
jgi:DNA invertase Pin-like site-specific DNA recombinase